MANVGRRIKIDKSVRVHLKTKAKRVGDVVQLVENLPSKCKTLSLNFNTVNKK
jgi:ribosomal protein S17